MSEYFDILAKVAFIFETRLSKENVDRWAEKVGQLRVSKPVIQLFADVVLSRGLVKSLPYIMAELDNAPEKAGFMIHINDVFEEFRARSIRIEGAYLLKCIRLDCLYVLAKFLESWPKWSTAEHPYEYGALSDEDNRAAIWRAIERAGSGSDTAEIIEPYSIPAPFNAANIPPAPYWDYSPMQVENILSRTTFDKLAPLLNRLDNIAARNHADLITLANIKAFYGIGGFFKMAHYSIEAIYYAVKQLCAAEKTNEEKKLTRLADRVRALHSRAEEHEAVRLVTLAGEKVEQTPNIERPPRVAVYMPPNARPQTGNLRTLAATAPATVPASAKYDYRIFSFHKGGIKMVTISAAVWFKSEKKCLFKHASTIIEIVDGMRELVNEVKDSIKGHRSKPLTNITFKASFNDGLTRGIILLDRDNLPIRTEISAPILKTGTGENCFCKPELYNCVCCSNDHRLTCDDRTCDDLNLGHISRHIVRKRTYRADVGQRAEVGQSAEVSRRVEIPECQWELSSRILARLSRVSFI